MKYFPVSLFLLFLVGSCITRQETDYSNGDPIEINLSKGLKNNKNYPLSYFVKETELIELESGMEAYTKDPKLWHIGEKYILVFDKAQIQIFLFSRQGRFIRKIGQSGKGPGEYINYVIGTMNKDETKILVVNTYSCDAIIYDVDGRVNAQRKLASDLPSGVIDDISWNFENCIDILPSRPYGKEISYPKIVQFNSNLELIHKVLPSITKKEAGQWDMTYQNLLSNREGAFLWKSDSDTVFKYDRNGESNAAFIFVYDKKSKFKGEKKGLNANELSKVVNIYSVNFLPKHLVVWVVLPDNNMFLPIYYDLHTGETFSVQQEALCLELSPGAEFITIENDLCGFEPIELREYSHSQNICVLNFPWELPYFVESAGCFGALDVKQPEIRDRLNQYLLNPARDLGMVLLIMHMN